ncbi:MAG: D-glycero-beta-D-manno-heptose-7-phosphate kinase, partial [Proteobacteria bacterium]|nr:D-glycero-beta-D-manno-heptose-7-phosphate kinase [Pseudomonadota bacterium]
MLPALDFFPEARVLVVGDVMMDQFIWGRVGRISPEAPVPVVDVDREEFLLGGAANVVRNIASLGGGCDL